MNKIRTHYDNLKIARDAPTSVIKKAYEALLQTYHPDKYQGNKEDAEKIIKLVTASYEILINPINRAKHDAWIRKQEENTKTLIQDAWTKKQENRIRSTLYNVLISLQEKNPKLIILFLIIISIFFIALNEITIFVVAFIWMLIWCFSPAQPEQKIVLKRFWLPVVFFLLTVIFVYQILDVQVF